MDFKNTKSDGRAKINFTSVFNLRYSQLLIQFCRFSSIIWVIISFKVEPMAEIC